MYKAARTAARPPKMRRRPLLRRTRPVNHVESGH
jgi:hypothetical protein